MKYATLLATVASAALLSGPAISSPDTSGSSNNSTTTDTTTMHRSGASSRFTPVSGRPYADNSAWNTPIGDNPTLDKNSDTIVKNITSEIPTANTSDYGVPIYDIRATVRTRRRVKVTCTEPWGSCPVADRGVPALAKNMVPSSGTDGQMVIINWPERKSYDFWQYKWNDGNPVTSWAAVCSIDLNGNEPGCSNVGAGVARLAGVVRIREVVAGKIDHALVFSSKFAAAPKKDTANKSGQGCDSSSSSSNDGSSTTSKTSDNQSNGSDASSSNENHNCDTSSTSNDGSKSVGNGFRYPATKTDGKYDGEGGIEEGTRVQLDPEVDCNAIGAEKGEVAVCKALQEYGAYNIDVGGASMAFVFEVPHRYLGDSGGTPINSEDNRNSSSENVSSTNSSGGDTSSNGGANDSNGSGVVSIDSSADNIDDPYTAVGMGNGLTGFKKIPWDKLRVLAGWHSYGNGKCDCTVDNGDNAGNTSDGSNQNSDSQDSQSSNDSSGSHTSDSQGDNTDTGPVSESNDGSSWRVQVTEWLWENLQHTKEGFNTFLQWIGFLAKGS